MNVTCVQTLPRRKIGNTDLEVATLGLGCAGLGSLYRPITDAQARETLRYALDADLSYLDTAPYYGFGLSSMEDQLRILGCNAKTFYGLTASRRLGGCAQTPGGLAC